MLKGKKIILGVTGSISAYKAVYLLRMLIKQGAEVQVIMTKDATNFVTELTFSTLSRKKVMTKLFEDGNWENHALLGRWADLFIIAPASANTIAKMAIGFCDNILAAVYLSAACPVMVAPAMDEDMWNHPATRKNISILAKQGVGIVDVETGELASGLSGAGRLAEPEVIFGEIERIFNANRPLAGKRVLITSGPTVEPIDPVRFISNHSTGKMGNALAGAFVRSGADVTIVTGPTHEHIAAEAKVIRVMSAREMYEACVPEMPLADIIVMAAAVADYTPAQTADEKIKKSSDELTIRLKPTVDILLAAGQQKRDGQIIVGFALETSNERENALAKLKKKKADFIILNSLSEPGSGFGADTNKVTIFGKDGSEHNYPLKSKNELAFDIVSFLTDHL